MAVRWDCRLCCEQSTVPCRRRRNKKWLQCLCTFGSTRGSAPQHNVGCRREEDGVRQRQADKAQMFTSESARCQVLAHKCRDATCSIAARCEPLYRLHRDVKRDSARYEQRNPNRLTLWRLFNGRRRNAVECGEFGMHMHMRELACLFTTMCDVTVVCSGRCSRSLWAGLSVGAIRLASIYRCVNRTGNEFGNQCLK